MLNPPMLSFPADAPPPPALASRYPNREALSHGKKGQVICRSPLPQRPHHSPPTRPGQNFAAQFRYINFFGL